ncbi:SLC13 family permease [Actinomycetospora lutea]|uniref:SLC13 family permease n=1 Tax=Actinomycetospora lutea TaxID=663604 RepID=UPI0023660DC5|nr:SLC13 family permease [Actinomycetospora lutea]MDD7939195.1 SLC13 family permease [Actinomycetospora lutea]
MSIHVIGVVGLVLVFVIGTLRPVNIGVLALIATFLVGTLVAGEGVDDLLSGFPPDLFVLLVGVTYLFGLVTVNGTLAWLLDRACGLLGDRPALVPWLIFLFAAIPTLAGALGPAGVAMLAPLCMGLGERYGIDRRLSALMVIHGSSAGNFSPLNGLAVIVNRAAGAAGLDVAPAQLFFGNLAANLVLGAVAYVLFGGLRLRHERGTVRPEGPVGETVAATGSGPGATPAPPRPDGAVATATAGSTGTLTDTVAPRTTLRVDQWISLAVVVAVAVGALVFGAEIGFLALLGAALLHLAFPERVKGADKRIVWSVVLLICGVVTYVEALERYGTIDAVGRGISGLGVPLLVAFLLCLVGAATSAFASSAGLLGVLIPLAAPFLVSGEIGAAGVIVALAISATVVDSTPFSSVGALTLANAPEEGRPQVFRTLLAWGLTLIVVAPVLCWVAFILPAS